VTEVTAPVVAVVEQPALNWLGVDSIWTQNLDQGLITGGTGKLHAWEWLQQYRNDVFDIYAQQGVETANGFYLTRENTIQLFLSLGCAAVVYQGIPDNEGNVWIDYHGDSIGMRPLAVTPYHIQAEVFTDLTEAFKMLTDQFETMHYRK
jgi:hypothetical protein